MLDLLLFNPIRYIKTKSRFNFEKIGNSNILARDSARELGLGPWVSYPTRRAEGNGSFRTESFRPFSLPTFDVGYRRGVL